MYGIRHGYPRLRKYLSKLTDFLILIRPYTIFIAFLVGYSLGVKLYGFSTLTPLLIGIAFSTAQGFGQVVNQITDVGIDAINKPYRPIPSGKVSVFEAKLVAIILFTISIFTSLLISYRFLIFNSLLLFLAFFYSSPPIRAKKHLWSIPWIAVSRGLMPAITVSYARYACIENKLLLLGITAFVWVLAYQVTKDIHDVEGDRIFNIKTLPVVYGISSTILYMKSLSLIYNIWLVYAVLHGLSPIVLITGIMGILIPYTTSRETLTENGLAWTLFYAGLGIIYFAYIFTWG